MVSGTLATSPYLVAMFADGAGSRNLYIMSSIDGNTLVDVAPNPVFSPSTSCGDPSIVVLNGIAYCAYTGATTPNGTYFTIASSTDLVNWTILTTVDCSAACAGPQNPTNPGTWCWAPDFFVDTDGTVYITVSINDRYIYWTKALNASLTLWSLPQLLNISGIPTYAIDSNICKIGSVYHLHYKNETSKLIGHATSLFATGPYTVEGEITTATWFAPTSYTNGYEGPCVVPAAQGGFYIYVDDSANGGHGLMRAYTTDPNLKSTNWQQVFGVYVPSGVRPRHGTVIMIGPGSVPSQGIRKLTTVDTTLSLP